MALARHARTAGNQVADAEQFAMVRPGLCNAEQAHAILGNADNVLFSREGKAKPHRRSPRGVSRACQRRRKQVVRGPVADAALQAFVDKTPHGGNPVVALLIPADQVTHIVARIGVGSGKDTFIVAMAVSLGIKVVCQSLSKN